VRLWKASRHSKIAVFCLPVSQEVVRDPKLLVDLRDGPTRGADKPDRLGFELRWILWCCLLHLNPFLRISHPQCSGVRGTGSIPT
jgi:hypothetical protein